MNYEEAVSYIHSLLKFGIHPGLDRMNTLLSCLGNPEKSIPFVHVAGTNGKGSVCAAAAGVLTDAGYKTGLYTSPYVSDFLERVQVNSCPVSHEAFASAVTRIKPFSDMMAQRGEILTEFEIITAAALLLFPELECDIAVLEVGLGGRLDATNVIPCPLVSVIASISLDHTSILGDTPAQIAFEKCGIIKDGGAVVAERQHYSEAAEVIERCCRERGATLFIPADVGDAYTDKGIHGTDFIYKGGEYSVTMPGLHQVSNMTAAIEAARALRSRGFVISDENIHNGIKRALLPARCEVISEKPLVILDGGHNVEGMAAFSALLGSALGGRRLVLVTGMMADKQVKESIAPLAGLASEIICVTPVNPRALPAEDMKAIVSCYCKNVTVINDASFAVRSALKSLKNDEVLAVSGSLYLAGEVRNQLLAYFGKK